jgi:hypothetical protein
MGLIKNLEKDIASFFTKGKISSVFHTVAADARKVEQKIGLRGFLSDKAATADMNAAEPEQFTSKPFKPPAPAS